MEFVVPTFETSRLILRATRMEDVPSYRANFVDYNVISQLSAAVPWPYPADGVEQYLSMIMPQQGKSRWDWGLFLKTSPLEMIGSVGLWKPGTPENRGFWLGKSYWGRGLMTEAVPPLNTYAFDVLGFEKLILSNALGNLKSRRIKEKTGATYIGNRPARFVSPEYTEAETWELSSEAWKSFLSKTQR
jgi:[ribosomal protein S5]-alanine N-acetyltransferase